LLGQFCPMQWVKGLKIFRFKAKIKLFRMNFASNFFASFHISHRFFFKYVTIGFQKAHVLSWCQVEHIARQWLREIRMHPNQLRNSFGNFFSVIEIMKYRYPTLLHNLERKPTFCNQIKNTRQNSKHKYIFSYHNFFN